MSEIGVPSASCQHQRVVSDGAAVFEVKLVQLAIDPADHRQQRRNFFPIPEKVAHGPGNLRRRKRGSRDLVEQRLEQVMVSLVDDCYANRGASQTSRDFQPTKSSTNNHNVMETL
jgi:hypothetical protein